MPQINHILHRPFVPVEFDKVAGTSSSAVSKGKSFKDILSAELDSVGQIRFSKHAIERMTSRNINFSDQQLERLGQRMEMAEYKGARESLMFMDDVAMVVNIESKTVVTCMNREDMSQHIFTNIDSAAFV